MIDVGRNEVLVYANNKIYYGLKASVHGFYSFKNNKLDVCGKFKYKLRNLKLIFEQYKATSVFHFQKN